MSSGQLENKSKKAFTCLEKTNNNNNTQGSVAQQCEFCSAAGVESRHVIAPGMLYR